MLEKVNIMFGCDPEFFFSREGKIIGAEKVLPKEGLDSVASSNGSNYGTQSTIIIDGVQAELNPRPDPCRANLGNEISGQFRKLYETMQGDKTLCIDFNPTVSVSEEEMETLSEKAKQFGCSPSKNAGGESKMTIKDASKYMFRSAGGHIHIGNVAENKKVQEVLDNPDILIPILDIIVGNTCVLLDRSEGNIERRKVYGKAGEYRTPPHGIEYRTLSNFWLGSYQLMSMVMGLTRQAVAIVASGHADKFVALSNMKDVRKAINENDFELAKQNFAKILGLLLEVTPRNADFTIDKNNIEQFEHFVNKGLTYWFNHDVLSHWINLPEGHDTGFESFLLGVVNEDMQSL